LLSADSAVMRKVRYVLILTVLLLSSCATKGSDNFSRGNPYGAPRPYGRHPGIDFMVSMGTPVIAPADVEVAYTRNNDGPQPWQGGFTVEVSHGEHFNSVYMHLTAVHVERGQSLKRGQLIGLSGVSNSGHAHLHFGICRKERSCFEYSETEDPDKFWLGNKPQCFDPNKDYSNYSQKEITLPVACGDYGKALKSKTKKID